MVQLDASQVITAAIATFFGGFMLALSGFGQGIVFQVLWALADGLCGIPGTGDLKVANAIINWQTLTLTGSISLYEIYTNVYKSFRSEVVIAFWPGDSIGIVLGNWVLTSVKSEIVKKSLSAFFCLLSIERLYRVFKQAPKSTEKNPTDEVVQENKGEPLLKDVNESGDEREEDERNESNSNNGNGSNHLVNSDSSINSPVSTEENKFQCSYNYIREWVIRNYKVMFLSFLTSIISGVLTGLFSLGGTPLMLLLSFLQLNKTEVRATSCIIFLLDMPARLAAAFYFGVIKAEDWALYLICVATSLCGGLLGHLLHSKVSSWHVQVVLAVLVLGAATSLLNLRDADVYDWCFFCVYLVFLFLAILVFIYLNNKNKR